MADPYRRNLVNHGRRAELMALQLTDWRTHLHKLPVARHWLKPYSFKFT